MTMTEGAPGHLRINAPAELRGMVLQLADGRSVVGRSNGSHVRLDCPDVSRTHAAIDRHGRLTTVEDLGSTHGTDVNGTPVRGIQEVRHGDQLRFGSVIAVFEDPAMSDPPTTAVRQIPSDPQPARPARRSRRARASPRFDVDRQTAGSISNVGGDQYIFAERQSFLREVAAARTRARRIILVGLVLFLGGFAGLGVVIYKFSEEFEKSWNTFPQGPTDAQPDVPALAMRAAVLSELVAAFGLIVMVVGIVLHVVAAARRRRVDTYPQRFGPAGARTGP